MPCQPGYCWDEIGPAQTLSWREFAVLLKLDIASIEGPEFLLNSLQLHSDPLHQRPALDYSPEFEQIEDQEFDDGRRLIVDNRQFRNCKFGACLLVYSGGLFGFADCTFDYAHTRLSLTGSAARAVALFQAIKEHPESGSWTPTHAATFG